MRLMVVKPSRILGVSSSISSSYFVFNPIIPVFLELFWKLDILTELVYAPYSRFVIWYETHSGAKQDSDGYDVASFPDASPMK